MVFQEAVVQVEVIVAASSVEAAPLVDHLAVAQLVAEDHNHDFCR